MTDLQYDKLLIRLANANEKYKKLLEKAEDEFKNRYGDYPSDIDYDPWIDAYHVCTGNLSVAQIEEDMRYNRLRSD